MGRRDVLRSQMSNDPEPQHGATSWIGQRGLPETLHPVEVETLSVLFDSDDARAMLWPHVGDLYGNPSKRTELWQQSLVAMRSQQPGF
jgi:hypothetical protein